MERLPGVFTILKAISEECVSAGRAVGRVAWLALLHLDCASLGTRVQSIRGHTLRTRWVCAIRHGAWVLSAFALTLMALPSGALALTFTTIDGPGAVFTYSTASNAAGQIVGLYSESSFPYHGFLWNKGTFTPIDGPGAMTTYPTAINAAGQIVGGYSDSSGTLHGFVTQKGHD